ELSLHRHEQLVEELAGLVAAHPLRERLARQLMLALYRSGRQADALAAARSFRQRLVEEQGLDPSRAFATLERAILRDDLRLGPRYPDGQLFVDLLAHTAGQQPMDPEAALEILLRQLGVPGERIPTSVTARSALWRAELAERRVLAVLDNAAYGVQVRPLLP